MQVGPHDAGTNACNWSPLPSYCLTLVPNWFDQWAWLLPTSLVCAAAILFLWAPLQGLIRIAAHFRRPIPLNEAAALIYGELRGTDLGNFTEGHSGTTNEILDNVGMQILHNAQVRVRRAPSPKWEIFPKSELRRMGVCGGATGVRYWGRDEVYYSDPIVSKRDVARVTKHLKRNANFRSEWSSAPPVIAEKPAELSKPVSPLQISVGTSIDFYELVRDRPSIYSLKKRFKIRVDNTDPIRTISGVKVAIISVQPLDANYRFPWVLSENGSINSGDHALVPLAIFEERREPEKYPNQPAIYDTYEVPAAGDRILLLGIETEHTFQLRCTANDVPAADATLRISVVAGRMQIEKV
jgi:hypothetical protein